MPVTLRWAPGALQSQWPLPVTQKILSECKYVSVQVFLGLATGLLQFIKKRKSSIGLGTWSLVALYL